MNVDNRCARESKFVLVLGVFVDTFDELILLTLTGWVQNTEKVLGSALSLEHGHFLNALLGLLLGSTSQFTFEVSDSVVADLSLQKPCIFLLSIVQIDFIYINECIHLKGAVLILDLLI